MADQGPLAMGGDLLLYNAEFQVVICKECEYAVQPAAISRHLKQRHKIYRKDREDILDLIHHLPLVEPAGLRHRDFEDPVPFLAILRGLYCTANNCTYMCESLKRMQQHWAASHDKTGTPDVDWQPTLMQTFFRGTCTRYFRVRGDVDTGKILGQRTVRSPRAIAPKRSSESTSDISLIPSSPALPELNLSDMSLFYHYLNFTAKTIHCGAEPTDFWTVSVPQTALQHPCLMHWVLATSAMHMASLQPSFNVVAKERHIRLGSVHQDAALPGFRATIEYNTGSSPPLVIGFSKLLLLQKAAMFQWSGVHPGSCPGIPTCESWRNVVDYLRFTRGNTAMIYSLLRMDPAAVTSRYVPNLSIAQSSPENPALEPMLLVQEEILKAENEQCGSVVAPYHLARRDVLFDMWQKISNTFAIAYVSQSQNRRWEAIIYFSANMTHDYLDLLEAQDQHATLLLAFYCVVIGFLDYNWWLTGHAKETLQELKRHLDPSLWHLIEWPRAQIEVQWVA